MIRTRTAGFGIRALLVVALAWLLVAGFLALQFWPDLPQSKLQWILLVIFGPPIYVLGESFFGWLFSQRHGQSVSSRTFSFKRILIALPVVLAFAALSWWLSWLLTRGAA
jgi:hypothetical protein